jgi:hypothetical protein
MLDLDILVRECVARVRPALPPSCTCKTTLQSTSLIHVDSALLLQALALLLQAACLRLRTAHEPCPRLSLRVKGTNGLTIVGLRYNASALGSREASAQEARALDLLERLGGKASVRRTRSWFILNARLASRCDADTATFGHAARLAPKGTT